MGCSSGGGHLVQARGLALDADQGVVDLLLVRLQHSQLLLQHLLPLAHLHPATRLCVAADVTGAHEFIKTLAVSDWRRLPALELHKIPTVFVLGV